MPDSGCNLRTPTAADMRLVRVPLASLDSRVALTGLAAKLGLPRPRFNDDSPTVFICGGERFDAIAPGDSFAVFAEPRWHWAQESEDWTADRNGEWQFAECLAGSTEKP